MNYVDKTCAYHPSKPSETICFRCYRLICEQDKRTYTHKKRNALFSYEKKDHYYCPICYLTLLEKQNKNKIYILLLYTIIALIMPLLTFGPVTTDNIYFYIYGWFFEIMWLTVLFARSLNYLNDRVSISYSKDQVNSLLNSLTDKSVLFLSSKVIQNKDINIQKTFTVKDPKPIVCFQCGEPLLLSDRYCPNCGESAKDESPVIVS